MKRQYVYLDLENKELKELLNTQKIIEISSFQNQSRDLNEYHNILCLELENKNYIHIPLKDCENVTLIKKIV